MLYIFGTSLILHHLTTVQQSEDLEECVRGVFQVLSFVFKVTYLTLVWCSYFCYSASVRESGGSAAVLGLINTITKYILKYSTDVYFIPNTNNINSIYGKNLPFTFVRSHL